MGNEDEVGKALAKEAAILFGDMEIAHRLENKGEVSPYQQVSTEHEGLRAWADSGQGWQAERAVAGSRCLPQDGVRARKLLCSVLWLQG